MGKTDINNLGQYFTPLNVAEYMANEVVRAIPTGGDVLDPCIGENIFFTCLNGKPLHLQGVEIDKLLITEKTLDFFNEPQRSLIVGDFIDQQFQQPFDAVIMNPPYTRQEKVSPETKKKLKLISEHCGVVLSAKANLYVYFLLKGLSLLKNNGLLVAITYDSWLYSSFGTSFKQYLIDKHNLKQIIHFKHDAFEGVDVGATLLVIQKGGKTNDIEYTEYESAKDFGQPSNLQEVHYLTSEDILNFNDHTVLRHPIEFPSPQFDTLDHLSDKLPWRGASSPANKYFLFKHHAEGLTPVLKRTPQNSYALTVKDAVYALAVDATKSSLTDSGQLEKIKQVLIETGSDSLKEKIQKDPYWYKFPLKPGGEILFNYYFRNNPRFILNADKLPTMGNYYNISCATTMYETFALLNSSLTRYALLRNSKSQGKGLRKIQLYKFSQIPILPLDRFTDKDVASLKRLGKLLAVDNSALEEIDEIVLKRYCHLMNADYNSTKSIIDTEINK